MSSKGRVRGGWKRVAMNSCVKKIAHPNKELAEIEMRQTLADDDGREYDQASNFHSYACQICGGWHWGKEREDGTYGIPGDMAMKHRSAVLEAREEYWSTRIHPY